MTSEIPLIQQRMRTPRAAGLAGIVFSLLTITSHLLIWFSIPSNPLGPANVVITHSKNISLALNLLSFAGIAFLWFMGVVRDRLGTLEDQFFSTIFLGSGLLYVAMIFAASAVAVGMPQFWIQVQKTRWQPVATPSVVNIFRPYTSMLRKWQGCSWFLLPRLRFKLGSHRAGWHS
jgi:hypothetical protein